MFSLASVSEATENNNENVVSEYDMIVPFLGKTQKELLDMGLTKQEALEYQNIGCEFINQMNKYSQYDDSKLRKIGFLNEQIEIIRNFSSQKNRNSINPENFIKRMPKSAWASVKVKCQYYKKRSRGRHEFKYLWYWQGRPFVLGEDNIAFAWDGDFRVESKDIESTIEYSQGEWDYEKSFSRNDIQISPGTGWKAKFDLIGKPQKENDAYAKRGRGYFIVSNPEKKDDMQMVWAYGHTTYGFGGFCLGIDGAASISINKGAKKLFEEDKVFKNLR